MPRWNLYEIIDSDVLAYIQVGLLLNEQVHTNNINNKKIVANKTDYQYYITDNHKMTHVTAT